MTLICKNTCLNPVYEHRKVVKHVAETDYKKCSKCCVFIKWDGIYCPCCGVRLSNRAKNNKARQERVYGNFTTL